MAMAKVQSATKIDIHLYIERVFFSKPEESRFFLPTTLIIEINSCPLYLVDAILNLFHLYVCFITFAVHACPKPRNPQSKRITSTTATVYNRDCYEMCPIFIVLEIGRKYVLTEKR